MKISFRISWLPILLAAIAAVFHFSGYEALAAEGANQWRHTYDLVMMWINFLILAFLLVKFGRKPLMGFLLGRREELVQEIERIEAEKQEADAKVADALKQIDESQIRLERIKERIIKEGENKKQTIIENAQLESKILLEEAQRKIDNLFIEAKKKYRDEMIDKAMEIVFEKLPLEITDQDNQRFNKQFLMSARID